MKIHSVLGIVLLSLVSGSAFAGAAVPEPGILELLSIGAVAALVVALRKRRK